MKVNAARAAREAAGMDLHHAAWRAGRSPAYLAALERGAAPWPLPLAQRLAAIYGCSLSSFLPRRSGAGGAANPPCRNHSRGGKGEEHRAGGTRR